MMLNSPAANRSCRAHLRSTASLAIGIGVLGQLTMPQAARAECVSAITPPPPALNVDYVDRRFDAGAPFNLVQGSQNGCAGNFVGSNSDGDPGFAGQPGGAITNTARNVRIEGSSVQVPLDTGGFRGTGAHLLSFGGNGGTGGNGGNAILAATKGGDAGSGAAGGSVILTFSGSLGGSSPNDAPQTGIWTRSLGGAGGTGGSTDRIGTLNRRGGDGGAGGAAGSISLAGSGSITASGAAVTAESIGGRGGDGGFATGNDIGADYTGGAGGAGGAGANAAVDWSGGTINSIGRGNGFGVDAQGVRALSVGGQGGKGGATDEGGLNTAGIGGVGGAGGRARILLQNTVVTISATSQVSGISAAVAAVAAGGKGGEGGQAGTAIGTSGGSGGAGGAGGTASATINATTIVFDQSVGDSQAQAVLVTSDGGSGGAGKTAGAIVGSPGAGGRAGNGGTSSLTIGEARQPVTITTSGIFANAALVQSIGGGGGNGGEALNFFSAGGSGTGGGNGGIVNADIQAGTLETRGAGSRALVAQSIGGGGGLGGNASGTAVGVGLAIGGTGGAGGNGGNVDVTLGQASVLGSVGALGNDAVLAQSIGGGGGAGGSAIVRGASVFALTIGGDAGNGGVAGNVRLNNDGLVGSVGDHAAGLHAQSIGGGGGKGGAAYTFNTGVLPVAAIAVGGRGGSGGSAGNAQIINSGQVSTYGSDSIGIFAQSIGGGGGSGGASAARAIGITPDSGIPAVSITAAIGGSGGSGNTGGNADIQNSGIVATGGQGASAVVAQSVGGGGGVGGDSSATAFSAGPPDEGLTMSVAVTVGGTGGTGGTGGSATTVNRGLLVTLGAEAFGLMAQSVGGGGGIGGAGDATSSAGLAKAGLGVAVSVGGAGGDGGSGGTVKAVNDGGITTGGDASDGVFAQSVGGGGGVGGGGVANAKGDTVSIAVGVGGSGGAGGDGGDVEARNSGTIVTRGTDAVGLFAQSVGGGGGKGGKGGATSGGASPIAQAETLFDAWKDGFGLGGEATEVIDKVFRVGDFVENAIKSAEQIKGIIKQLKGKTTDAFGVDNINVSVSVGGQGGAAGNGKTVAVVNSGEIITFGAQSDGIYAQSVGGGGGSAGAASSVAVSNTDFRAQASVAIGGKGGGGGSGGSVSVLNDGTGSILTRGVLGIGIFAQSVGGGGGEGAIAGTLNGSLASLGVGIGGDGGKGGNGGAVTVTTIGGGAGGSITTTGKHGVAVFAQSVGGGGGLVRSMTDDETFDPELLVENPQGRIFDVHGFSARIGGRNGAAGAGGTVAVAIGGAVSTSGLNAHGVLAQSIGGGGGTALGGRLLVPAGGSGGDGGARGDGGAVSVRLDGLAKIETSGAGAYGILAQSIGGGGGVAGDLASVDTRQQGTGFVVLRNSGNAAGVTVDLQNASVRTTGDFAPAIFAQSIGGGGGLTGYDLGQGDRVQKNIQARGTAGGTGAGGAIAITLQNARVTASGRGSYGIFAQSDGTGANRIQVSVDKTSVIEGGSQTVTTANDDLAAIVLQGGTDNLVINAGFVRGDATSRTGGTALRGNLSRNGFTVNNTGTIIGDIVLNDRRGNLLDNQAGGIIRANSIIADRFRNAGSLEFSFGGTARLGSVVADFEQTSSGTLIVTADLKAGSSDQLSVSGKASLAGAIAFNTPTISNRPVTVLTAAQGLTITAPLQITSRAPLFGLQADVVGNELRVSAKAQISAAAASLGANSRSVAANLQSLFDNGASFDAGFTALSRLATPAASGQGLSALSGQGLGTIGAYRFQASNGFTQQMFSGCATADKAGADDDEANCGWARIIGGVIDQDSTADASGYRATTGTFQTGAQRQIGEDWHIGGSLAYEMSAFSSNDVNAKLTGNSILGGAYVGYSPGRLLVTAAVDAGYGWFESRRFVAIGDIVGIAQARPEQWHAGAHARVSYQAMMGRAYVQPFAEAHAVHVQTNAFAESGLATFGLAVSRQSDTAVSGSVGIELGSSFALAGGGFVRPFVRAAYQLLNNNDWATRARFADQPGGPGFEVLTPAPDQLGIFALGVDITDRPDVDFSFQYTPVVGSGYVSHAGVARMAVRF